MGGWRGRLGWGLVGQAAASGITFAFTIGLARQLRASEFGAAAVGFAAVLLVVGAARALTGEIALVTGRDGAVTASSVSCVAAAVIVAVIALGPAAIIVRALVPTETYGWALAVVAVAPAIAATESRRLVLISRGDARVAALQDAAWLSVSSGVAIAGLPASWVLGAWTGGAVLTVVFAARGHLRGAFLPLQWLRSEPVRRLGPSYLAEFMIVTGSAQFLIVLFAVYEGAESVGALRAAQTLLGPANIAMMATGILAVPELTRMHSQRAMGRGAIWVSSIVVVVAAAWGAVVLVLPPSIGSTLLGASWKGARHILPVMVMVYLAMAFATGPASAVRAARAVKAGVTARAVTAASIVSGVALGLSVGGLMNGIIGWCLGWAASALVWWLYALPRSGHRIGRTE